MGIGPPAVVEARPAAPPRVGLIPSLGGLAAVTDNSPELRWGNGLSFNPEGCDAAGVYDPCIAAPNLNTAADSDRGVIETDPFVVWASDKCSSFDGERDWRGRAERALNACVSMQVAHELWTGDLSTARGFGNRFLAGQDSDVVASGANLTSALACLEQGLSQCACGQQGMIHATPQVVTHWNALGLVRREGQRILTVLDTIVVPDAGYDGSGQYGQNAADGSIWAYATGMVEVRLGPVQVFAREPGEQIDRTNNTRIAIAQRMAAVSWDGCCHLAAEIDLSTCGVGGS